MGVQITGADAVARSMAAAGGKIDPEVRRIMRRIAGEVKRRMKDAAPQETGRLGRSISLKSRGTRGSRTVLIGPRVTPRGDGRAYAVFQEVGTARMEAQPYVAESLDGVAGELEQALASLGRRIT